MRKILLSAVALLAAAGHASATTYQLTYTSSRLLSNPPYKRINGVTKLTMVFTSPTPFPKNQCFALQDVAELTSFSDGVDTISTLTAAGYSSQFTPPSFQVCSDRTGRHILQWQLSMVYTKNAGSGLEDFYTAEAFYPAQNDTYYNETYYDGSQFYFENQNPRKSKTLWDISLKTGLWKYKVIN